MIVKTLMVAGAFLTAGAWSQQQPGNGRPPSAAVPTFGNEELQSALSLGPVLRDAAVRKLASDAREQIATQAATYLIRSRAPDADELALQVSSRVSEASIRNLLSAAGRTPDTNVRRLLARAALRRVVDQSGAAGGDNFEIAGLGNPGYAAMLLAGSGDSIDRQLVGKAVVNRPHDPGFWLALATMGPSLEERRLASTVFRDVAAPQWARLAAAALLSPGDRDAGVFVTAELLSYLNTFGQIDILDIVSDPGKLAASTAGLLPPREEHVGS